MLHRLPVFLLLVTLVAGCGSGGPSTSSNAGPTTPKDTGKVKSSAKAAKPEIDLKVQRLEVEKGKSAKYTVGVDRVKFDGDVNVTFEEVDASGIKIAATAIPAGKDSVEVTVTADPKAGSG